MPVARRVPGVDRYAEAAFLEPLLDHLDDLLDLFFGRDRVLPVLEGERFLEPADGAVARFNIGFLDGDPCVGPRGSGAVVDRPAFLGDVLIELRDREQTGLQLESRGDAVESLHPRGRKLLSVSVKVDESGSCP